MTYVDPWVDPLTQLFEYLQNTTEIQQREILARINLGRTRSIAANLRTNTSNQRSVLLGGIKEWSDSGLQDAYMRGARTVTLEPLQMSAAQTSELRALQERAKFDLQGAVQYQKSDYDRFVKRARTQSGAVSGRWMQSNRIAGAKYRDGRRINTDAYARMQIQTATSTARNLGVIHAATQKGIQYLEVQDGHECGWDGHDDSEKANGKIIKNDHDVILLSHPYCVRTFIPRPDLNKNKVEQAGGRVGEHIKSAAIARLEAAAIPIILKSLFTVEAETVDEAAAAEILSGGFLERALQKNYDRIQKIFAERKVGGEILPFHGPPPEPEPVPLDLAVGSGQQTGISDPAASAYNQLQAVASSGGPQNSIEDWKNDVMKWGDALIDKRVSVDDIPDWLRASIDATTNKGDAGDNSEIMNKILSFADKVERGRESQAAEASAKVLNFLLKKKSWNQFDIYGAANKWGSEVRGTWTKYGPRVTTDFTDFLRGRFTFTKDGIRRTITLNPAGAIRTNLGLTQDGTLIGNLRYVPNRFFSAVAEINDFGKLESEVRFNPFVGGRMRLMFESPRPRNWLAEGLQPGQDFVDFREGARSVAGHSEPWTPDLIKLSQDEMRNKWWGDKNFRRFVELQDKMQTDFTAAAEFRSEVEQAYADQFTDNKDVQLWLSVVSDLPENSPRIYRGVGFVPEMSQFDTTGEEFTFKEFKSFLLENEFVRGERVDMPFGQFTDSRKYAQMFAQGVRQADRPPEAVPVIYRVTDARGYVSKVRDIAFPDGSTITANDWNAGGSYIVNNAKWDSKVKAIMVDLEPLGPQTDEALAGRRFGVEDFSFRDLFGEVKKMRLKDVIFDVPVVNKSIADLSAELRIPIAEVRGFVTEQFDRGLLKLTGKGKYTGRVSFNPAADLLQLIADSAGKQKIIGSLSFSQYLPNWASFLEPEISAQWVRSLPSAAGEEMRHMQEIIANMRMGGLGFLETATKTELSRTLRIPVEMLKNFGDMVDQVDARIRLFLIKNQRGALEFFGKEVIPAGKLFPFPILRPRDISGIIEDRLAPLLERGDVNGPQAVFRAVVDAIRGVSQTTVARTEVDEVTGKLIVRQIVEHTPNRPLTTKFLKQLAGIELGDSRAVIESKLYEIIFFLRSATLDNPEMHDILDGIDSLDISLAAWELGGE